MVATANKYVHEVPKTLTTGSLIDSSTTASESLGSAGIKHAEMFTVVLCRLINDPAIKQKPSSGCRGFFCLSPTRTWHMTFSRFSTSRFLELPRVSCVPHTSTPSYRRGRRWSVAACSLPRDLCVQDVTKRVSCCRGSCCPLVRLVSWATFEHL